MSHQIEIPEPQRWYWEGLVLLVAGLYNLHAVTEPLAWLSALGLPGSVMLIGAGAGLLAWPGDPRLPQIGSLGAVVALAPLPILALQGQGLTALWIVLLLIAAFLAAGSVSLRTFPRVGGAPTVALTPGAAAKLAVDEMVLGYFIFAARPPRGADVERIANELDDWQGWLKAQKLRGDFRKLHPRPPDLLKVDSRQRRLFGRDYRSISFASGYQPAPDMPGAERWMSYSRSHTAHAWVLEHAGAARPWLVTIHGYRMGEPWIDLGAFDPRVFHDRMGMNIASIVLPLHGPRRRGLLSGHGFMEGDVMDLINAELQAQWDIRRLISWLRLVKHAPAVGAYGISLGGYNAALLAGLEGNLACVVAGMPLVEISQVLWRHLPIDERAMLEQAGVGEAAVAAALAPVAPLSFKPRLARDRLGIFAGAIDRLVWPDQPLALAAHWGEPRLSWYEGSHLTFMGTRAAREILGDTFAAGELLQPEIVDTASLS